MSFVTVIMYHYVRPIKDSRYPRIKGLEYNDFIEQLKYLNKNYVPIKMKDLIENINGGGGRELPNNAVLLTFDDAYIDHFKYVYPALKKLSMEGSFYTPVKAVTEGELLDVNKVHFILASCTNIKLLLKDFELEFDRLKKFYEVESFDSYYSKYAVANRFDDADTVFFKRALQVALPEKFRIEIVDVLFKKYVGLDTKAFCEELYMTKEHLEHLINDEMHIGSHGYDHYWWNKLPNEKLNNEILKSRDFLEAIGANKNGLTACYPYGSWSESAIEKLKKLGFDLAFTTEVDIAKVSSEKRFLLPRLDTNDIPKESAARKNKWHPEIYLS